MALFDFGIGNAFGQGGSQSQSDAKFLTPDFPKAKEGYDLLQPGIKENELQQRAVSEQEGLRGRIAGLLSEHGQGERARIADVFGTAANNATGGLARRGFAGSSLNIPAQLGVARERNLAESALEQNLTQQRIGADTGITKNISDLLFGSSEQSTNLLSSILGAGGIGNFAKSKSLANAPGGGGGGGGSVPGGATGDDARQRFEDWKRQFEQPGGASGGGGGGSSGGGGSGGGGGAPTLIQNPFEVGGQTPASGADNPAFQNDPTGQSQSGVPLEDQELEEDMGPLQSPDEFARNKARLEAKASADTGSLGDLAGGPGDALGGGLQSGFDAGGLA